MERGYAALHTSGNRVYYWYMWLRGAPFLFFIVTLSVLALAHLMALRFELYWTYVWLDVPMHLLGGAAIAFGVLMCAPQYARGSRVHATGAVVGAALLIGIGWEVFEWWIGAIEAEHAPVLDTTIDLVANLVGALFGMTLIRALARAGLH